MCCAYDRTQLRAASLRCESFHGPRPRSRHSVTLPGQCAATAVLTLPWAAGKKADGSSVSGSSPSRQAHSSSASVGAARPPSSMSPNENAPTRVLLSFATLQPQADSSFFTWLAESRVAITALDRMSCNGESGKTRASRRSAYRVSSKPGKPTRTPACKLARSCCSSTTPYTSTSNSCTTPLARLVSSLVSFPLRLHSNSPLLPVANRPTGW
mmetsp:Transcript_97604/g.276124  ORF Transcript_97604/g.276124 Transcript_97604/m.276124 type:complete len:212 (-) Transcript_97604:631-1266(-)